MNKQVSPGAQVWSEGLPFVGRSFKLQAGEDVMVQQVHGAFALMRNHADQAGWVKTGEISPVIPPPAIIHKSWKAARQRERAQFTNAGGMDDSGHGKIMD